jgi:hypothetical protein
MSSFSLYSFAAIMMLAVMLPTNASEVGVDVVFSKNEASIIRAYYRDNSTHQTKKNKKNKKNKGNGRSSLPPGIAKNLGRGKPLPPGIAKQYLPENLISRLPPPPHGFERVVLSGKVLLVEVATQVIHDVLEDVILDR